MTRKAEETHEERCPKCDYCKECGRSKMDVVPPYVIYPRPMPYIQPWWGTTSTPRFINNVSQTTTRSHEHGANFTLTAVNT